MDSFSNTKTHVDPIPTVHVLADIAYDHALRTGYVTADDLRRIAPLAPNKTANYGAAFRLLLKSGRLVFSHYTTSRVGRNHGRKIGVYTRPLEPRHRVCP